MSESLLCGCGHDRDAHLHYRAGSECALCDCPKWSPRGWVHRLASLFRR